MIAAEHTLKMTGQFAKPAESPYTKIVTDYVQIASRAEYITLKMFQGTNIRDVLKLPYKI